MSLRTAKVVSCGPAPLPLDDGVTVLRILTDSPDPLPEFYMELVEPGPAFGDTVSWGSHHVWWNGTRYRKRWVDRPENE